ncbi:MAG: S8 family serine peptidase [Phycisphaeraceae bacterium]|nr:S8 family serine peptidase [Phycisphaeraceae bacterium]MCW5762813.1 S8 family serine peptidase [Phycisphaeraceae bacterium]
MIDRTLSTLVLSACAGLAVAQATDADFQRHLADPRVATIHNVAAEPYFDQQSPLSVYPQMIAVYLDPAAPAPQRAAGGVAGVLAAANLAGAETQASTVPGWTYVMLPADGASLASAQQAVHALAALPEVGMASLVYLGQGGLPVIPTRDLLIAFDPSTPDMVQNAVLASFGAAAIERDAAGMAGLVRARTDALTGAAMLDIAQALNDHPLTLWAQSDRIFWARRMGGPPNDPMFAQQWALEQANNQDMDALAAWAITIGDPAIRVVVLDSGTQQDHPDISQVTGQSFTGTGTNGGPGNSCDNHGTAVAGCIAATINNGIGIVGIAPGTRVQAGKIFNEINFFGFCLPFLESQDSWTVAGINWAASSGARVTNSSWGGGAASAAITTAFNNTRAAGVLHFAAAGNDGTSTVSFPANLASLNAVAALASTGDRASFSTYGNGLFISAPGAAVLTTDRTGSAGYASGDWTTIDGTSFASPYAAGVAALVLSANPALTPAEVEAILAQTAVDKGTPGYDTDFGWGFINAGAAVAAAAGTSPCLADFNGDGELDFFDVSLYLSAFANLDPIADLNGDGNFDFFDVSAFLSAFSAGCP